jgi:pyruvate,water dikinase
MTTQRIVWFDDPRAVDVALVGGKCRGLATLVAAGAPVPVGFAVTTEAFHEDLAARGVAAAVAEALSTVDPADETTAVRAEAAIGTLAGDAWMPAALATEIAGAYRRLCDESGGDGVAVAVRSSATAEDLDGASFAGQQDTFLNIEGADAVLAAVRRCWDSLYTARAILYRARTQHGGEHPLGMGVVVQALVPARAAGVIFTVNPLSGDTGQAVIEAAWGLGEAVVSGSVTPDRFVVDKRTGETLESSVAHKVHRVVPVGGGTETETVPPAYQGLPCLTAGQRRSLCAMASELERQLGGPQDIEWAVDHGGASHLLQARPVTAVRDRRSADDQSHPTT